MYARSTTDKTLFVGRGTHWEMKDMNIEKVSLPQKDTVEADQGRLLIILQVSVAVPYPHPVIILSLFLQVLCHVFIFHYFSLILLNSLPCFIYNI